MERELPSWACWVIAAGVLVLTIVVAGCGDLEIATTESKQPVVVPAARTSSIQPQNDTLAEAEAWWEDRIDAMYEEYKALIVADQRTEADELAKATYAEYDAWAELPEEERIKSWLDRRDPAAAAEASSEPLAPDIDHTHLVRKAPTKAHRAKRPQQPAEQYPPEMMRHLALSMAQDFVKAQLLAPGSAKWPGMFESADHTVILRNNRYRVRSWVDSHNGFGALIRTHYTAVLKNTDGKGINWRLESLDLDG